MTETSLNKMMTKFIFMLLAIQVNGVEFMKNENFEKKVWKAEMVTDINRRHCSSPTGINNKTETMECNNPS